MHRHSRYFAGRRAIKHARRRTYGIEAIRARTIDLVAGQTDLLMAGRLVAQACGIYADADSYAANADGRLEPHRSRASHSALASSLPRLLNGSLMAGAALSGAGTINPPVAAIGVLITFAAIHYFGALRRGAMELGRTLLDRRAASHRVLSADEDAPRATLRHRPDLAFACTKVTAGYDAGNATCFDSVDLDLRAGEKLGVRSAPADTGKSTLLSLLAAEIEASHGGRRMRRRDPLDAAHGAFPG